MKLIGYYLSIILVSHACMAADSYLIVAENYPPYEYADGKQAVGLDVDVLKRAAKLANIELKIEFYPWRKAMKMVQRGRADAIISLNKTDDREGFLMFPDIPLSIERVIIFKNKKAKNISNLYNLNREKVGVISGYSYSDSFEDNSLILKHDTPDQEALVKQLDAGSINYILHNDVATYFMIKKLGLKNIEATEVVVSEEPLYIGFSMMSIKADKFHAAIDESLKKMEAAGELKKIRDKYLK